MAALPGRFDPAGSSIAAAAVQFHFTGAEPSDWTLTIDGPVCRTAPGVLPDPAVRLTVDSDDFMAMLSGEMQPMAAFMRGKLKVAGDVSLAMQLVELFR